MTDWEVVIGLEVHAELKTASKMFCACPTVDVIKAAPNSAVCPVCLGLPGALPVVNRRAVELGARAALALGCTIQTYSIFARKNYFYPDLPKGYQISQYETPLAVNGLIDLQTSQGIKRVRILRTHLEEDTGKLTHVNTEGDNHSLVDLNRAGVPLLEIVSEPDMRSVEEAKAYAVAIHRILRYIDVSSCDMEKGAIRFEANISIRPRGSDVLNTRTEIKNLNSFRALERASAYEIQRQIQVVESGGKVIQETVGWNDLEGVTFSQRSKEEAHDYRYFPEPDLPPLVVDEVWLAEIKRGMLELPDQKAARFKEQYGLSDYDTALLVEDRAIADYFEQLMTALDGKNAKQAANWVNGEMLSRMNESGLSLDAVKVTPAGLAGLIGQVEDGKINLKTAKQVYGEMFSTGKDAGEIIREKGLVQISDNSFIRDLIGQVIAANPGEVQSYLAGKETLANWFFGQVMARAKGQASPNVIREELARMLAELKNE